MKSSSPTRLTIGIPAYKNALTLRTSVETLLAQTYGDFKILISDDNSPDDTQAVCLELASQDSRIEYIRQPKNLKYQNFGFLLRSAKTEYFMWAAGDDRWHPDFVRSCIEVLDANPDIVLATPRIEFEMKGKPTGLSNATFPLIGDVEDNIRRYLAAPGDNSRMYGVFRTEAGQRSFPLTSFHAYDLAFCAATLRFGGHAEIPRVLMVRDQTPGANYLLLVRADSTGTLSRLLPFFEMSRWLLQEAKIPRSSKMLGTLLAVNVDRHFWYTDYFHKTYTRINQPIQAFWRRYVGWRLLEGRSNDSVPAVNTREDR